MTFWTLNHFVKAVVLLVALRHVQGAARIFSPIKGEPPSSSLEIFFFAYAVVFYKAFQTSADTRFAVPGLVALAGALWLFEWARRTIRGKFFSYALSEDTPEFLLTSGPYACIRNPFYTSYLLIFIGTAILFPGIATLFVLLVVAVFLWAVARFEERKFERSALAGEYAAYRRRTGMFVPRLRRRVIAESTEKP